MKNKLFSLVITASAMLLVLSACVAVPILCRPFYYAHIFLLDLPGRTGFSAGEIRRAFDQALDFCTGGAPFGAGVLAWSEGGKAHFADCAALFRLDFALLFVSSLTAAVCLLLCRRGLRPARLLRRGPLFWAGSSLAALFAVLTGLAALDFDGAFVAFHRLFFPGKDNWLLNADTDQIILILPQAFFRDCAILIAALLFFCCFLLVLWDVKISPAASPQPPPSAPASAPNWRTGKGASFPCK